MFTCTGTGITIVIEWRLNNNSVISVYRFERGHTFPRNVPLLPEAPVPDNAVVVQVTNATENVEARTINITSTLSVSNVSILTGSVLHCQDGLEDRSSLKNITVNRLCM